MGEEGGPRKHCRDPLLPRGDTVRTRSTKGLKCDTTRDCHLRIALLRPMPPTNECTYSIAPTRERSSTVLGPLEPRCAAGSIPGTAPARWPECRIRAALCSQGLAYGFAS